MSLQDDFEAAQKAAFALTTQPPPQALLTMYALFKQATHGDVSGERPGAFNFKGRAKYDAWAERKGMSADDAMTNYIAFVSELSNS